MRKLLIVFLLALLINLSFVSYWVYEYGGLKYYLSAVSAIKKLPEEERLQSREAFDGEQEDQYSGTLIKVDTKGFGGAWIWGRKGPKYFKADKYSIFSYYNACEAATAASAQSAETFEIERVIDTDIKVWQGKVGVGDWTSIILTVEGQGGTIGNIKEAISYDEWLFMSTGIQIPCEK